MVGSTAEAAIKLTRKDPEDAGGPEPFRQSDFNAYLQGHKNTLEGAFDCEGLPVHFSFRQQRRNGEPEGDVINEEVLVSTGREAEMGFKSVVLTRSLNETGTYDNGVTASYRKMDGDLETFTNDLIAVNKAREMSVWMKIFASASL
jgi:hypothetical protein